jgi:chemotaxis protein methyltransferase CheR
MDFTMTEAGTKRSAPAPDDVDIEIDLLLEAIYRKYSYEFRNYARPSMRRRLLAAVARLDVESVSMLQHAVLRDRAVFTALLTQITVPVTEMFRDPDYFAVIRTQVLPLLGSYPSLKIWVAGCSTGEEVYSLAILLEESGLLERSLIYATDINPEALRAASEGVYPVSRVPLFTRNYQRASGGRPLADYYTAAYGNIVFHRHLRSRVVFSSHSLATDAVFAEVQLVSCRNVLIYFNRDLQNRALGLFRDALVPHGFLGLGTHERVDFSRHEPAFEPVAQAERIYRRVA